MKSRFLKSVLATAAILAATAGVASAADPVTFMIDWLPAGDKAPIYYGVQKGIFSDAGLDVTIAVGRGSSDVVTKLSTGAADVGSGGLSALLQAVATEKAPAKAVMTLYTKQPDAIFTTTDSGIEKLADVAGKKVATATFSSSNVVWPLVLEANGVDPSSVQLIKVDPGALAPMLATGQVDATINWMTVAPAFAGPMKEANKTFKALPWSEYGFDGYGLSIFTSDNMISERPEVLKRFLVAYKTATEMAIKDPEGAAAAVKVMVPEIDEATAAEQWKASIPLMVNDVSKKDGIGAFEPELLKATWSWVAKSQGLAADALDPESAVNRSFLK
ncbi:NitT/TauT family transport system substrate-binding protein [Breoghania corrubedonensis]|uniref:NitT/TauT family transport system substrate-binding protein n=1 Tax=Breoghania corrubedonensis TaxID=665038 RepID=A0A2T5VBC9_9HYPH|nr:ABC transporter substrate-binding protein [Breoghania corrubedonensis]PTW61063.1 NitT/TauT family transport system substrate-binding protein [Breoghania corrubedonensis]